MAEREMLKSLEQENKLGAIINRHYQLSPQSLSHKVKTHNTMISEPLVGRPGHEYVSYLMLDDDCAEMSDHNTGFHIQGMVLTEAARQMMLAVGEKYLLDKTLKGQAYFALRKVNSEFFHFAFPIEMKIVHHVLRKKVKGTTHLVNPRTEFVQNNQVI